jgi:hypothetical protein
MVTQLYCKYIARRFAEVRLENSKESTGSAPIDTSQYRLLFGFFLIYTDRVPFELLDSAALLRRESCGGGGQIVFLNLTTII